MSLALTVNAPKVARKLKITYEGAGENLAEAIDKHGESVVYTLYSRMLSTDITNGVRVMLNKNQTDEQIRDWVATWRPGITNRSGVVSTQQALDITLANLDELTDEQLLAFQAKLTAHIAQV